MKASDTKHFEDICITANGFTATFPFHMILQDQVPTYQSKNSFDKTTHISKVCCLSVFATSIPDIKESNNWLSTWQRSHSCQLIDLWLLTTRTILSALRYTPSPTPPPPKKKNKEKQNKEINLTTQPFYFILRTTSPLFTPKKDAWETTTEIQYWWHVPTQI